MVHQQFGVVFVVSGTYCLWFGVQARLEKVKSSEQYVLVRGRFCAAGLAS